MAGRLHRVRCPSPSHDRRLASAGQGDIGRAEELVEGDVEPPYVIALDLGHESASPGMVREESVDE
jgi:hypothetical protein